jgi:hypothetical protein
VTDAAAESNGPEKETRITPEDIESKFRELQGDVDVVADDAVNTLVIIGAAAAVGILVLAYMIGKRRGRKRSAIVEVRRL